MEISSPGARSFSPRSVDASPSTTCIQLVHKILQLGGGSLVADHIAATRTELITRASQLEASKEADTSLLLTLNTLRHRLQQPAVVLQEEPPISFLNMPRSIWHGFPIYKIAPLSTFAHELKAFIDLITTDSVIFDLRILLERVSRQYESYICAYATATDEGKAELAAALPELTGDSIGSYLLDHSSALAIVCRDKYGFVSRENEFGNHPVRAMGGIHFKPNPKGLDFLGVAEEFMVHSLGEILSGGRLITTPTSLLKISHVPMIKISKHPKKNRDSYKTLVDAMVKGISAGQIFEENPALFDSIEKKCKDFSTVIQAGLSIDGVLLMQLLEALQNLEFLNSRLTPQKVLEVLPRLMSDCFQSDLFDDYSHFRGSFNPSLLYESYLGYSATLSPPERFVEFQQLDAADSRREHVFMKLCTRNRSGMLAAFALVKKFPSLMKGAYLSDLQRLPASLALLQNLLPSSSPAQIMETAPRLLEQLDMYSFSAIFVLSLLTSPSDGKADNYMVQLEREPGHGNVRSLRIVGIDNDKVFEPAVRTNKQGQIYPGLKSIVLCLPNAAMPVDPKFRAAFLALNPEMIILSWLAELHEQNQRYQRMENLGLLTENDKFEKKTGTRTLDIPISISTAVLQNVFEKLLLIHRMLTNDANCSHRKLFEAVEPLLSRYYANVLQTTKSPLEAQRSIYHGDYMTVGASSTSLAEEAFGLAVRSPTITNERPPLPVSLETVIKDFVGKLELGNLDPTLPVFRSVLVIISTKFPFVKRLPFNTLQLRSFLLHASQTAEDTDLPLFDSVLRSGSELLLARDEVGRTPLHCLLSRPTPNLPLALLKRILAERDPMLEERDAAGQKPLHCLLKFLNTEATNPACTALSLLLQAGVDIDGEDGGGDSVIRQSIKRDLPWAFARLALLGAGRHLPIGEVKPFIERYAAMDEWKKEMRNVTKALVKVNFAVAMEYGIRSLLLPLSSASAELTLANVIIGLESGKGALRTETADRLFDVPDTMKPDSTSFLYLTPYDQSVLCNVSPKSPLMEVGCQALALRLFGFSSPQCELFRAERTGLPTLLYQAVDGFNLAAVMSDAEKRDSMLKNIDLACFSELVLMHLITMQEVQRDDLYLVPHFNNRFRLFSLRNRAVLPEVVVRKAGEWTMLHRNYVFCMDQLTSPLDPTVRLRFLQLEVGKTLSACFTDLVVLQKRAEDLFGVGQAANLNFPYRLGITSQALLRRFQLLHTILSEQPASTSMLDLLSKVSHMLGAYYRSAFKARKTADSRYEYLADRSLTAAVEESFVLPVEVHLNQPLFEPPMVSVEDWVGRVDFKNELIFLSRLLSASRTVRQLVSQLNNGQVDPSLISALDEDCKARLLHRFNWSKLPEDKQRLLFDALFPRNGTWSLKCLYIDAYPALDNEMLGQCMRQERGVQLVEIALSSLALIDVHKLLVEISKRAPNIEKLRLHRLGTRSSNPPKAGAEAQANEPGKLLRFAALKSIHCSECHRLEFVKLIAPELRVLETTECEKLQVIEVVSRDSKESIAPHMNLTSVSVINCPNVSPTYVEQLAACSPSLRAIRFAGLTCPTLFAYYFSLYNLWGPVNVSLLSIESTLNLSGSLVTDSMLERIIPYMATIRTLDLSGCSNITAQTIAALVASCPNLETVRFAATCPPEEKVTRIPAPTAMQILPSGRVITGHTDGQVKLWEIGSEVTEKKDGGLSKLHSDAITFIENGPYGQIACGSADKSLTVVQFNFLTDKVEWNVKLKGHDSAVRAARFLPDGTLVTVATDRTVKVWELISGKCLRSHAGDVGKNSFTVAEFVSNNRFVGGGEGALLSFFAVDQGKETKQVISDNGAVQALRCLTPELFASGGSNGRVKVWNSSSGECIFTLSGHSGTVKGLIKLPLCRVASFTDNTVRVWEYTTGSCICTVPFNSMSLTGLQFLPDGRLLLATLPSLVVCSLAHPVFGRGHLNLVDLDFLRGTRFSVEQEGTESLVAVFAEARGAELVTIAASLGNFLRPLLIGDNVKLLPGEDRILISPLVPQARRQELQVLLEGIISRHKERATGRKLRVSAWNVTRLQITSSISGGLVSPPPSTASPPPSEAASSTSPTGSPSSSPKGTRPRADGGRLSISSGATKQPSPPDATISATMRKPGSPGIRTLGSSVFFAASPVDATRTSSPGGPLQLRMPASAPVPIPSPPNSPPRELPAPQPERQLSSPQRQKDLYNRTSPSPSPSVFPHSSASSSASPMPSPAPGAVLSSSSSSASSADMRKISASPARSGPLSAIDTPPSTASALEHTSDAQPGSWVPKKTPTQTFLRGVKGNRSSTDPLAQQQQQSQPSPAPAAVAAAAGLSGAASPSSSSPLTASSTVAVDTMLSSPRDLDTKPAPNDQPKLGAGRMMLRRVGSERMEAPPVVAKDKPPS